MMEKIEKGELRWRMLTPTYFYIVNRSTVHTELEKAVDEAVAEAKASSKKVAVIERGVVLDQVFVLSDAFVKEICDGKTPLL